MSSTLGKSIPLGYMDVLPPTLNTQLAHAASQGVHGRRIEEIQKTVFNLQKIAAAASSLPDGGAKLHSRIANLRTELAQLQGHGKVTDFALQVKSGFESQVS